MSCVAWARMSMAESHAHVGTWMPTRAGPACSQNVERAGMRACARWVCSCSVQGSLSLHLRVLCAVGRRTTRTESSDAVRRVCVRSAADHIRACGPGPPCVVWTRAPREPGCRVRVDHTHTRDSHRTRRHAHTALVTGHTESPTGSNCESWTSTCTFAREQGAQGPGRVQGSRSAAHLFVVVWWVKRFTIVIFVDSTHDTARAQRR